MFVVFWRFEVVDKSKFGDGRNDHGVDSFIVWALKYGEPKFG